VISWGDLVAPAIWPEIITSDPANPVVDVAAGGAHLLLLHADGTVAGYGNNGNGQATTPPGTRASSIAADANTSLAVAESALISFVRAERVVQETGGRIVTFHLKRSGLIDLPVSITYRNTGMRALPDQAGAQLRDVTGIGIDQTITLAPGITSTSLTFTVKHDTRPESAMGFAPVLVGGSAIVRLAPQAPVSQSMTLIAESDVVADGQASNHPFGGYVGAYVFNTTGAGQTITRTVRRGRSVNSYARTCARFTSTYRLRGTGDRAGVQVRYFRGSTEVTRAVRSSTGLRVQIRGGQCLRLRVGLRATASARVGSAPLVQVRSEWRGDVATADVVNVRARVVR